MYRGVEFLEDLGHLDDERERERTEDMTREFVRTVFETDAHVDMSKKNDSGAERREKLVAAWIDKWHAEATQRSEPADSEAVIKKVGDILSCVDDKPSIEDLQLLIRQVPKEAVPGILQNTYIRDGSLDLTSLLVTMLYSVDEFVDILAAAEAGYMKWLASLVQYCFPEIDSNSVLLMYRALTQARVTAPTWLRMAVPVEEIAQHASLLLREDCSIKVIEKMFETHGRPSTQEVCRRLVCSASGLGENSNSIDNSDLRALKQMQDSGHDLLQLIPRGFYSGLKNNEPLAALLDDANSTLSALHWKLRSMEWKSGVVQVLNWVFSLPVVLRFSKGARILAGLKHAVPTTQLTSFIFSSVPPEFVDELLMFFCELCFLEVIDISMFRSAKPALSVYVPPDAMTTFSSLLFPLFDPTPHTHPQFYLPFSVAPNHSLPPPPKMRCIQYDTPSLCLLRVFQAYLHNENPTVPSELAQFTFTENLMSSLSVRLRFERARS